MIYFSNLFGEVFTVVIANINIVVFRDRLCLTIYTCRYEYNMTNVIIGELLNIPGALSSLWIKTKLPELVGNNNPNEVKEKPYEQVWKSC